MNRPTKIHRSYRCIWCGAESRSRIPQIPVSLYRDQTLHFWTCSTCKTKQIDPSHLPRVDYGLIQKNHIGYVQHTADNEWINTVLRKGSSDYWTQQAINFLYFKTMDGRYRYPLHRAIQAYQESTPLRILEIGCNLGYFGAIMLRLGHHYVGLDIQKDAIKKAQEYYGNHFTCKPVEEYASQSSEKFDLICSFDVIEHVHAPRKFFMSALSLLGPDGSIILTTPDGNQMPLHKWNTDLPPIHITLFSRRSFKHIASNTMQVKFINDIQLIYTIEGIGRHLKLWLSDFVQIRDRFKTGQIYPLSVTNPDSPDFFYGPSEALIESPFRSRHRIKPAFAHLVYMFACAVGVQPVGPTMIVEVSNKKVVSSME